MNKKSIQILVLAKKIKGIKLLGSKCEICGNENIFHLSFHHIDLKMAISKKMNELFN